MKLALAKLGIMKSQSIHFEFVVWPNVSNLGPAPVQNVYSMHIMRRTCLAKLSIVSSEIFVRHLTLWRVLGAKADNKCISLACVRQKRLP